MRKEKREIQQLYDKANHLLDQYKESFGKLQEKILDTEVVGKVDEPDLDLNDFKLEPIHKTPDFESPLNSLRIKKKRKSQESNESVSAFRETKEDPGLYNISPTNTVVGSSTNDPMKRLNGKQKVMIDLVKSSSLSNEEEYSVVDLEEEATQAVDFGNQYGAVDEAFLLGVNVNGGKNQGTKLAPKKQFKYSEVVRKKSERAALPGHECEECKKVTVGSIVIWIHSLSC